MTSLNLSTPARALAIGAHPDDIEFGCGGTLAKWAAEGCVVSLLVCTNGAKGSWDPDEDGAALVVRRQHEQRRAAATLGASGEIVFLSWPDGELESGLRQRAEIASWIRRLTPDVVLGHDPWKRYRLHPDHRHAGLLTTEGIVAARDPLYFPELGFAPHRPRALLLFEADEPDHYEDIASSLPDKLAALLEHESQLKTTMDIAEGASNDVNEQIAAFGRRVEQEATSAGHAGGIARAEAFKLMDRL